MTNTEGRKIKQDVVLRWQLKRPIDQGRRLGLLIAAMLVAIALPLMVLAVVNRLLARFEPGDVRHAAADVRIHPDGSVEPARPLKTDDLTAHYIQGADRRQFTLGDTGLEFRSRASFNPLGSPQFEVATAYGRVVNEGKVIGDGAKTEVTAGLGSLCLLVIGDETLRDVGPDDPVPARLLVVTRDEGADHLDRLVLRCRTALEDGRWTGILNELPFPRSPCPGACGARSPRRYFRAPCGDRRERVRRPVRSRRHVVATQGRGSGGSIRA